jgi:hypothetical protein
MLTILPTVLLFFTGLFILLSGKLRIAKGRIWLVASISGLISWVVLILLRFFGSTGLVITTQITQAGLPAYTAFQITGQNWTFAFTLVTVLLAVILFETRFLEHESNLSLQTLSGSLILTAAGLLAVIANSERAFAIAWGIIDLIELSIVFIFVRDSIRHQHALGSTFLRMFGLAALFLLMALKSNQSDDTLLQNNLNTILIVTLCTAIFRSGVLMRAPALSPDNHFRRGAGTLLRVIPPITVLAFLVYSLPLPMVTISPDFWLILLSGCALIAAIRWATTKDELDGRPSWLFVIVLMAISASIKDQPGVILSLGVLALTLGPLLSLTVPRTEKNRCLLLIPLIGFTMLPFTGSTPIVQYLTLTPIKLDGVLFGFAYLVLLLGYIRYALTSTNEQENSESWMKFLHVLGLITLGIVSLVGGLFFFENVKLIRYWWIALIFTGILVCVGYLFLGRRVSIRRIFLPIAKNQALINLSQYLSQSSWQQSIRTVINWFIKVIKSMLGLIQQVLEGDGGIFWSLLFLSILASLLLAEQVP